MDDATTSSSIKEEMERKKETVIKISNDICRLCSNKVYSDDWRLVSPCCNSLFHFSCLHPNMMLWVKKENSVICPRCTDPSNKEPHSLEIVKAEVNDRMAQETTTSHKDGFKPFIYLSPQNRREEQGHNPLLNVDLLEVMDRWKRTENMEGIEFAKKYGLTFDKLLSMQWSVNMIKTYIAKDWDGLVDIGFTPDSMKNMKAEQIDDMIVLYDMSVHTLRNRFGSIVPGFTIRTLHNLRLQAKTLKNMRINMHELACMGLDRNQLPLFSYIQLSDWVHVLSMRKQHLIIWNICTQKSIEHMGTWELAYVAHLFDLKPQHLKKLRIVGDTVVCDTVSMATPLHTTNTEGNLRPKKRSSGTRHGKKHSSAPKSNGSGNVNRKVTPKKGPSSTPPPPPPPTSVVSTPTQYIPHTSYMYPIYTNGGYLNGTWYPPPHHIPPTRSHNPVYPTLPRPDLSRLQQASPERLPLAPSRSKCKLNPGRKLPRPSNKNNYISYIPPKDHSHVVAMATTKTVESGVMEGENGQDKKESG